ncbi:MAG TPA: ATP-binding cassette domain-containing protein, partial [bacterium]|nr:ATP-binding cassette domain-containing protein [bacterium]
MGPNGAGKTTLLETIIGTIEPDRGYVETFARIGYLAQDLELPPDVLAKDYFNFPPLESDSLKRYIREMRLREDILTSRCGILSGGEKTKLKLIEVLINKPSILILDEPTNHLDIKGIEVLEEKLEDFYGTLIVVSHDRFFLDRISNKILEISRGKVSIYPGNYTDYSEKKRKEMERAWEEYEEYTEEKRRLEESVRKVKEKSQSVGRIKDKKDTFWRYNKDFYGRKASKVAKTGKAIERRIEKLDVKEKPFEEQHIKMGFGADDEGGDLLVYCEDIEKSFGDKLLFKESNISIKRGEKIAL